MQGKLRFALILLVICMPAAPICRGSAEDLQSFAGQDLHLSGKNLVSSQLSTNQHCLLFTGNFSLSIGGVKFTSDNAVVRLDGKITEYGGRTSITYEVKAYLSGNISTKQAKNAPVAKLTQKQVENGTALVVHFEVTGEVFVTADKRETAEPSSVGQSTLYKKAEAAFASLEPTFFVQKQALVPGFSTKAAEPAREGRKEKPAQSFIEKVIAEQKKGQEEAGPRFMYPVNIAPAGESPLKIESIPTTEGLEAATVIGRFYIWQKQDESGRILELQADSAVIFYGGEPVKEEPNNTQDIPANEAIKGAYLAGDVLMTDGSRTIRADEIYYDFETQNGIILNASMRTFDESRNIPIYVRAAKVRKFAESKFAAENVTITSSEFYKPQISATAASAEIVDTTNIDSQGSGVTKNSYQAEMRDVKFKLDDWTFFSWPRVSSNLERPEAPIKMLRFSQDNRWGPSLETEWFFARLLGLNEPEGVDGTVKLDYYGKRGPGGGAEIDYTKETYYGRILGYVIHDHGEDDLGRDSSRRNIEPGRETRGRFSLRHRQFLTDKWQLTTEFNYSSDENFIESFYRGEFNVYRPETYIHLKQIKDNRALSILSKWRTNGFEDVMQESPTVEYHRTADSLPSNVFSLYTDIQVSHLQQKIGEHHTTAIDENPYTFISYRSELDMPLRLDTIKVVPYIAGTFGYDDRSGFRRSLVDGSDTGPFGEEQVWIGEAGVRIFPQAWWKVYPNVKSQLWDLDQLRHIIQPSITAAIFEESDKFVDQPDIISFALSQRFQTKRGPADKKETVDWMRLDTEYVMVEPSGKVSDAGPGPDRFLWAKPIVPLRVLSAPQIFNGDLNPSSLHRFELYGPKRDYMSADYFWRLSDTTAMLSDLYYDTQSGTIEQFDVGFSRLAWPNLSYYIGSRYLKRTEVLNEKGSNAFTFAATYILDPRYTAVFAQQFDFDYGSNIRSDITLIRKYHRVSCAFTISVDDSLARRAVMFSIWPEGIKEMAFGDNRYMELGGSAGF
jgi:hypothetical protein